MGTEVVEESEMQPFVENAKPKLAAKKTALFGSYGWGDGEWMRTWSAEMKTAGANLMDDGLIVNETPDGASADECVEYGRKLAVF
jgi:flavorubredoxin